MFRKFSEWAVVYAIRLGYIKEEEQEEYTYGLDLVMSVIASDLTMLIIGIIMKMIPQVIVFVFMYKFIRKYTGGFHCETALTCYLSSSTMCICVLLAIKYLPYNLGVYIVATVLSIGVLFAISPIEAINKPLEEIEVKVFGKRARIVLCITLVIFGVICAFGLTEMVKTMAKDPIIFAMANPTPEIMPDVAKAGGARVVATGRSDFPNQINNVLVFPGIFRGALDVRATDITEEMKLAASRAIASLITPEELNEEYIIPSPFDKRVCSVVAKEVGRVAREQGIAKA